MDKITLPLIAAFLVIPASSTSAPISPKPEISIVTLNMAKETSASRILREWSSTPLLHNADILLLQEVKEEAGARCIANRLGNALGLHVAYSPEAKDVTHRGLAILSRFPLRSRSRARFALCSDGGDAVGASAAGKRSPRYATERRRPACATRAGGAG